LQSALNAHLDGVRRVTKTVRSPSPIGADRKKLGIKWLKPSPITETMAHNKSDAIKESNS